MTKVYLVEETDIGDRYSYITGVFATLESAIASVGTPGEDLRDGPADIRPGGGRAVWMADHRPVEILEWTVTAAPDPLGELRAEVEAQIDSIEHPVSDWLGQPTPEQAGHINGSLNAYRRVLDLIDKHAREGQ